MDFFSLYTFGSFHMHAAKLASLLSNSTEHVEQAVQHLNTKLTADIMLCIFLVIYLICYFLRTDSFIAVVFKYLAGLLTGGFLCLGLFLDTPTLLLKATIGVVLFMFSLGFICRITLAIRCKSLVPLCADDDCFVNYNAGGKTYCMPFDPNEPYLTLVVHQNGITCGSYKLYGDVSIADRIYLVTLTKSVPYSLQNIFDAELCTIAFYIADCAVIEDHTTAGKTPRLELKSDPIYEVPCATIDVPL
ncbi:hypothetical protein [Bat Hp-betacoronavirus/Zhejiang2013]|uniref:Uncharacterized protein n=1 Tax=Bat Hp-betacoronavirus/Zhejiang2013 TaxID=1541205 RepID=A0A088DI21_9BETC|nr:ORF4 protein [Bat Hp-betacoronavirus/Zhejiang2013]AIL94217.1 hypothetical protein [Bat Hp-betacoronavirus/Zhejiang2013]